MSVSTIRNAGRERMKLNFQQEGLNAAPAVAGVITAKAAIAVNYFTLSNIISIATLIYIICQIAFLIWKWRKEARS